MILSIIIADFLHIHVTEFIMFFKKKKNFVAFKKKYQIIIQIIIFCYSKISNKIKLSHEPIKNQHPSFN